MARNPSISLTEHQQEFVQALVSSGRYHGVSEVVRAGLRLLEDEEERRAAERQMLEAGIKAGLDDIRKGRVSDFDAQRLIVKGEAILSARSSSE
ncbi:type II toxin-antitoxin system ParD family antitoxin [Ruegeria sp. HKCCA0370]|uniref:type II toxin-antitoxin system ParD family antitoxin n=1 Tax=Ruegeria sp. HKCCA0370 TaxID=2682995 RepID=UPI0014884DC3|nr:type II toxin-antitoxin system ParD family antitoxin [Ruegeria sp. HKCCA0370]